MPIPVSELKKAIQKEAIPPSDRILEFLREHPEVAYTEAEIYAALEDLAPDTAKITLMFATMSEQRGQQSTKGRTFQRSLQELVNQKRVVSAVVKSETYYSLGGS
jgi:hypothetical protein